MILRRAQTVASDKASGQSGLFGVGGYNVPTGGYGVGMIAYGLGALHLPEVPDWPPLERLGFEAEAIGFHLTAHPLDAYAQALRRLRAVRIADLPARAGAGETRVKIAGTVVAVKERATRTGNRMAFVRLTDSSGSTEVTVFSEVLHAARELIAAGTNLLIGAELQTQGESLRATAFDIAPLERAAAAVGAGIRVWLAETAALEPIRAVLSRGAGGRGRVFLLARTDRDRRVELALPGGFGVTPALIQALGQLPGVERVEDL